MKTTCPYKKTFLQYWTPCPQHLLDGIPNMFIGVVCAKSHKISAYETIHSCTET